MVECVDKDSDAHHVTVGAATAVVPAAAATNQMLTVTSQL
jgi:hypothetical protein